MGSSSTPAFTQALNAAAVMTPKMVSATAITEIPKWVSLCGKSAPFVSMGLFLAPLPTIQKIAREKSVGDLPALPYSSMMVNAFVWFTYGVLKGEMKVWSPNLFGCILGTYYFKEYRRVCPKFAGNLPGTMSQHIYGSSITMVFTVLCALLLPKAMAESIIGSMGVFFCVVLFGSPLSSLRNVIATRSAKSIPLPFTFVTILNCALWSVFGTLEMSDFNIYAPNLLGLMLGLIQLFIVLLFGDGPQTATKLPL